MDPTRRFAVTLGIASVLSFAAVAGEIVLPVAPHGKEDDTTEASVTIDLKPGGTIEIATQCFLFAPKGTTLPERETLSLDRLSRRLSEAKSVFHYMEKRQGRSGYSDSKRTTKLVVRLRAHKDAPARHVHLVWLMCAENRFLRVAIVATDKASDAYGAREAKELGAQRAKDPGVVTLPVTMRRFREKWVDPVVIKLREGEPRCRVDDKPVPLTGLGKHLQENRVKEVNLNCSASLPFKYLVIAFDQLRTAGISSPWWRQGHEFSPTVAERAAVRLPPVGDAKREKGKEASDSDG